MSLAHLYDPIYDDKDFSSFVSYNFTDHIAVKTLLLGKKSVTVPLLDIRVADANLLGVWALNHQTMHDAINSALGVPGSSFVHIDYRDPEQVNSMRWLHAEEHRQWHQILGN